MQNYIVMNKTIIFLLVASSTVCLLLNSCMTGATRADDKFRLLNSGQIDPKSTLAFASCLHDGFLRAHYTITNIETKQQRRVDGWRVETYIAGRMLCISADVLDTGRVELWKSPRSVLINTSGEVDAFAACLAKYGIK
jgi:hypothetical protein